MTQHSHIVINVTCCRQCILGNAIGEQGLVDLRTKQTVHCFKGGAGSIRAVLWHPNESVVASCGLDRYLRIHDVNSRQLLHKVLKGIWWCLHKQTTY